MVVSLQIITTLNTTLNTTQPHLACTILFSSSPLPLLYFLAVAEFKTDLLRKMALDSGTGKLALGREKLCLMYLSQWWKNRSRELSQGAPCSGFLALSLFADEIVNIPVGNRTDNTVPKALDLNSLSPELGSTGSHKSEAHLQNTHTTPKWTDTVDNWQLSDSCQKVGLVNQPKGTRFRSL